MELLSGGVTKKNSSCMRFVIFSSTQEFRVLLSNNKKEPTSIFYRVSQNLFAFDYISFEKIALMILKTVFLCNVVIIIIRWVGTQCPMYQHYKC